MSARELTFAALHTAFPARTETLILLCFTLLFDGFPITVSGSARTETLILLCFTMLFDGFPITVSGSGEPLAGATRLCRNGASADGEPFVFTTFYKDSALGFTSSSGASPTHGQGP